MIKGLNFYGHFLIHVVKIDGNFADIILVNMVVFPQTGSVDMTLNNPLTPIFSWPISFIAFIAGSRLSSLDGGSFQWS